MKMKSFISHSDFFFWETAKFLAYFFSLSILYFGYLFSVRYLCYKYFLTFLMVLFDEQKFLILMYSDSSVFLL